MKVAVRVLALAGVTFAIVWLWGVLFPNPDSVIRKRLAETARAASFGPGQSYISRLSGAQHLADLFATNVEVIIDVPGHEQRRLAGREDIQQAALAARSTLDSLNVTFPDVALNIAPDKKSAIADLTAEAKIAGDADLLVQEMKFTLTKAGREWLIARVETIQTLQKPGR